MYGLLMWNLFSYFWIKAIWRYEMLVMHCCWWNYGSRERKKSLFRRIERKKSCDTSAGNPARLRYGRSWYTVYHYSWASKHAERCRQRVNGRDVASVLTWSPDPAGRQAGRIRGWGAGPAPLSASAGAPAHTIPSSTVLICHLPCSAATLFRPRLVADLG
jgi:hypothetical protein